MSRRPGIGLGVLSALAEEVRNTPDYLAENFDVPAALNFGGKSMPLGQYMTRRLRKEVLHREKTLPEAKALRALRLGEEMARTSPGSKMNNGFVLQSVSKYYEAQLQKIKTRNQRDNIYKQEKLL